MLRFEFRLELYLKLRLKLFLGLGLELILGLNLFQNVTLAVIPRANLIG